MAGDQVNVWSAGADEFVNELTRRSLLERQARLDAEDAARQQAQLAMQRQQMASVEADRQAQANLKAQQLDGAQLTAAMKDRLTQVAMDPSTPEPLRQQALGRLQTMGVNALDLNKILHPAPAPNVPLVQVVGPNGQPQYMKSTDAVGKTPYHSPVAAEQPSPLLSRDANGNIVQVGTLPPNGRFIAPASAPASSSLAAVKDDPKLPVGVKRWIESISQHVPDQATARQWLAQGWPQQTAVHPHAELPSAAKYLDSLYPEDSTGMNTSPFATSAAPSPALTAAPAMPAMPVSASHDTTNDAALRAQAIDYLKRGGKLVNDATIATVMGRMRALTHGGQ